MATYVFSDVHGHRAPLERLLERVQPGDDDRVFCLGDMIDRGPDPVGVIETVRSIPNCTTLVGNHEAMMLDYFADPDDFWAMASWAPNGAATTLEGLSKMDPFDEDDVIDWVRTLGRWLTVEVGERSYLLVHAGIDVTRGNVPAPGDLAGLETFMEGQDPEDLVWIRDEFWGTPTGLVGPDGAGTVVIAGHTPTLYLKGMAGLDREPVGPDGRCRMVRLGASVATGGVHDKWNIDCGAASGSMFGNVLMLRLDDEREFMEPVLEGE